MVGSAGTLLLLHLLGWYPQLPGWYPQLLLQHLGYDHGPSRLATGKKVFHNLLLLFGVWSTQRARKTTPPQDSDYAGPGNPRAGCMGTFSSGCCFV